MKERTGTVNCMIASIVICIIAELIGPLQFKVMGIDVKILTFLFSNAKLLLNDDADCITTWLTPWIRKKCCGWNVLSLQRYGTWYYRR